MASVMFMPEGAQVRLEAQGDGKSEVAAGGEAAEADVAGVDTKGVRVSGDVEQGADAVFDGCGEGAFGRQAVCYGYEYNGDMADDHGRPAGVVGRATHCEAATVKVDDDGISLATLDLASVVGGDVEGELEACAVGAIEGCSGEVTEEGRSGG